MELSLSDKIREISKHHDKQFQITGRELFNSFGFERRSSGNCAIVDNFLADKNLMVSPHYNDVWIDFPITLMHKPVATTKVGPDPIVRVKSLEVANKMPLLISNDATLTEAMTLMQINKYSQLPVTSNGPRGLCGFISWESIGVARANGIASNIVKDYKRTECKSVSPDTPLLDAIHIVNEHDFAVVLQNDKSVCGIITTADISNQFLLLTEPFVLLEEIENQIRVLLNDKFLLDDIKGVCQEANRVVSTIDDLTFGEYIALLQKDENWMKLNINIDKKTFLKMLDDVRAVRNDVMHFDPDGISSEQKELLISAVDLLNTINQFVSKNNL